jgi:murein DD-endopeptidase MepM/ murein hydrolase activator NlpD
VRARQAKSASKPSQGDLIVRRVCVATTICMGLANAAAACEVLEARESPLEIRKPVRGEEVHLAAGFGMRMHPLLNYLSLHMGVDWAAPHGTPVIAAGRGRVSAAGVDGAYGNRVIIDHGGAWQTLYSQLASFSVREGGCVEAGTVIGAVGTTGLSVGPHLHFEVRRNGEPVDPLRLPVIPQGGRVDREQ